MNNAIPETPASTAPLVHLDAVQKHFGKLQALKGITLSISAGECLGLVGHNGAGKSTLVKIINGRLSPTLGAISYRGAASSNAVAGNAEQARAAGIRSVFQELSLCPNLTVLENYRIPFRDMPRLGWRGVASTRVMKSLDTIFPGHSIQAGNTVEDLSIAERQMVEIAIAFSERKEPASLMILDEPTSSLDAAIARQLLDYINTFCRAGGSVIFISHMLGEIFDVASRIIVMKDGTITDDRATADFNRQSLVDAMGHVIPEGKAAEQSGVRTLGEQVLSTEGGLNARKHEIVGLAGLAGHGQTHALATYYLDSTSRWRGSRNSQVVFVAGDRARDGLMPLWSILQNLSLKTLIEFGTGFLIDRKREQQLAVDWKQKIGIRTDDLDSPILSLSGGNQQKVLFARALASTAPIVVMDDPMRGVDVGTKKDVYAMIQQEAAKGRTFLWYSTETDEILECDRVFVYRDGQISAELIGEDITEENILTASFGMKESAA
ncbi:ATP-binding cassette domain-containing protein [Granulosicoccus antarcticus]|uniref:Ribose import ATP-binding protein RbsA n=1 Tax=Granulosicoccus antarcticus IMCC3135 TaxID=1192854 RepID=A0A2Z2P2G1_9GAMM|nr:sugar ABC transporter ATP-binding protein [Granulosicoccus antarcticus]ASJ73864.1 Ribose import ATP-binding protein RbsA [Granulosicoccus antarcticus IMCC3135]